MNVVELIRRKRDGGRLSEGELRAMVAGASDGSVPDYQLAALLMAILLKGLDEGELAAWTDAMVHSGDVVNLDDINGIKVDKHSTGGVGDMISLALAPLAASCGVVVPMISGRGLGHTGGTLDKLEAIPGFRVDLPVEKFKAQLRAIGVCMIGQTERLAPADRRLYALRDVTGTVESVPLIASSIMSKKLAEGIDALVLDVKVGSGAFMKPLDDARTLAKTLIAIGRAAGKRVTAFLTDMDQPLGRFVGNALEVREAIAQLRPDGERASPDVRELVHALTAEMIVMAGQAPNLDAARVLLESSIASGAALERFAQMVEAQGGDPRVIRDPAHLHVAPGRAHHLFAEGGEPSEVVAIDAEQVGLAALSLGAGRARKEDVVDPAVGLELLKKVGDDVSPGEPLVVIHHRDGRGLEDAHRRLAAAYRTTPIAMATTGKLRIVRTSLIKEVLR